MPIAARFETGADAELVARAKFSNRESPIREAGCSARGGEGGAVKMPLRKKFWALRYGGVVD